MTASRPIGAYVNTITDHKNYKNYNNKNYSKCYQLARVL